MRPRRGNGARRAPAHGVQRVPGIQGPGHQARPCRFSGRGLTGGVLDLSAQDLKRQSASTSGQQAATGVDVEGSHLGDVEYDDAFTSAARRDDQPDASDAIRLVGSGSAVRTALDSGDLPYQMKGLVTLDTPFGKRKVAFTRDGRAPLRPVGRHLVRTGFLRRRVKHLDENTD